MLVWANKSQKNIERCTKAAVRHDTSSHPGPRYEPSMTPRAKFPLDELPTDILHTIADIYRREKAADAASALQAALRRHRIQRCEDPAHQGRVTYARRPVPCFEAAHAHPGRVVCTRNRQGYLEQARTRLSGTAMVQTRGGGAALSPPGTSGGGVDSM